MSRTASVSCPSSTRASAVWYIRAALVRDETTCEASGFGDSPEAG